MQAKVNSTMQYTFAIILAALLVGSFTWMSPTINIDKDKYPTAEEIAALIKMPDAPTLDNEKLAAVYDEIFKEDESKEIAENLALEELKTRNFKKDLINFIDDEISKIKDVDYRDIAEINVRDVDVDLDGNNAEVLVEFKVYVNNYGDEDEQEKVRLSVLFFIEDLDEDDDYEDAEVDGYDDLELIRFYD